PRLFAVADGFGGRGDTASSTAIDLLRSLDAVESGDLLNVLNDAADRAHQAVGRIAGEDSGTTLTAMLWTGSELGLVHIGDSRAYLLRDGRFFQITHDHTLVQSMLDDGRITPQEAESHPQRALLVQALGTGRTSPEPEVRVTDVRAGDRYLLCTDGLSARVAEAEIRSVVEGAGGPTDAVAALVELSIQAGGADNVACVVAIID
ncbi:PP2C family protein-serine/threonine phosphatase, partial [Actinospica sp.]|uniref:PP2C family protein-serine/threonine phosphatase n=1 Tax=Actinospica sp. TaxID=1872142 RepID=UPI002B9F19D1